MNHAPNSLSRIVLSFGALATCFAAGCGVDIRPRTPTFQARAAIVPATVTASSQPAAYAPPPAAAPAPAPASTPAAVMPEETATVGQYQQNGGTTVATAEKVAIGSTLVGRVAPGANRYYVIDMQIGDSIEVKAYARTVGESGASAVVEVREPDDVVLDYCSMYTHRRDSWERDSEIVTAKQAGPHMIYVKARGPVEYKVLLNGKVVTK